MTKQLKRSINRLIKNIEDTQITPEAEEMILEAVKVYTEKIAAESKNIAYKMNRKTIRKEDVEDATRKLNKKKYPLF